MENSHKARDGIEFILEQGETMYLREYLYCTAVGFVPLLVIMLIVSQIPFPIIVNQIALFIGIMATGLAVVLLFKYPEHKLPRFLRFPAVALNASYVDEDIEMAYYDPKDNDQGKFRFRISDGTSGWEFKGDRKVTKLFVTSVTTFDPTEEEVEQESLFEKYGEPKYQVTLDFERLNQLISSNGDGTWELEDTIQ